MRVEFVHLTSNGAVAMDGNYLQIGHGYGSSDQLWTMDSSLGPNQLKIMAAKSKGKYLMY